MAADLFFFLPEFQPVTAQNCWDYFKLSPFYDRGCLNEYIAMQGLDQARLNTDDGTFYRVC